MKINGRTITQLGEQVNPGADRIEVEGRVVTPIVDEVVYLLHKPIDVITTAHDPAGRATVLDLVPKAPRVFPCGRLDERTSGLVVLTNNGGLCYELTHPKFEHQKEYYVHATGGNCKTSWQKLQQPISLNDGTVQIDDRRLVACSNKDITFYLTLHDGRNRIVRRICAAVGLEVKQLVRTKLGPYALEDLPVGGFRRVAPPGG